MELLMFDYLSHSNIYFFHISVRAVTDMVSLFPLEEEEGDNVVSPWGRSPLGLGMISHKISIIFFFLVIEQKFITKFDIFHKNYQRPSIVHSSYLE